MAIFYFIGALLVIRHNTRIYSLHLGHSFQPCLPVLQQREAFMGATIAFAINRGVNRGLFSNESGQGSAPIAHSAARAPEPVSEGMVAILEPFIDTIIICFLTGLVVLSSGVWTEKIQNQFQSADMTFLNQDMTKIYRIRSRWLVDFVKHGKAVPLYNGQLDIVDGKMNNWISLIVSRSVAEDFSFYNNKQPFTGKIEVVNGKWKPESSSIYVRQIFNSQCPIDHRGIQQEILGKWGQYIVSIGILLFAFSTAISWSYYGDRALTFLVGPKYVIYYRIFYVIAFFIASFTDTTIIWSLSYITIAFHDCSQPDWLMDSQERDQIDDRPILG